MEENNQYDELLVRYLFNESTSEEKVFVENWLNSSEENRRYFNRLQKTWQLTSLRQELTYLADEANLEKKWDRLEQDITQPATQVQFEAEYPGAVRQARKPVIYRALAIAASVLFVIGIGLLFLRNNKPDTSVAQRTATKNDTLNFVVHHEVNTTGKEKSIQLADGSLIVLGDNSEVTYREPFTDKRDITLTGKAYFKVAHDEKRPFTVTSGDVSTTVLGTEFSIAAFSNTSHIIIRLYEGKVVVRAVDKANKRMKNDIYLLPGQELVYGGPAAVVRSFSLNNGAAPGRVMHEELASDSPSLPEIQDRPYFMFNNELLGAVFDDLAALYQVKIIYSKRDVQNIYFTRKYNRTDSLEAILREIGTIHHLTITKSDNAYRISK